MRILMSSYRFAPSIGGIEEVTRILAEEFVRAGHELTLITETADRENLTGTLPYDVVRQPSRRTLLKLLRRADVYFQNNISLQYAWPLLLAPKPWVVAHHIWIRQSSGKAKWSDRFKRFLLRFARNIAVSEALAAELPVKPVVIGNPYRAHIFREFPDVKRDRDLIFVGRLVTDKGLQDLFEALALLRGWGIAPSLTVIGIGEDEARLKGIARELRLGEQVRFAGAVRDDALARALNEHRIMVVPSRWKEPFGIVALEGIACGCVVVGSEGGGLKDAIGSCGVTYPNGDMDALAKAIRALLENPDQIAAARRNAPAHLARFQAPHIAAQYLAVMKP